MESETPRPTWHQRLASARRALRHARRRGMSLIEIMVVIVIILTLMSAIGYGVWSSFNTAMEDTTRITMGRINEKVEIYMLRHKKPPGAGEGLRAVFDGEDPPTDGWGNEFRYVTPGPGRMKYDIISYGADGKEGGTGSNGDIRWSKER